MNEQQIRQLIQQMIDQNANKAQYGVAKTPFHDHNGINSPKLGSNAAGSNTQIQFNDNGNLGATSVLTYDKNTTKFDIGSGFSTTSISYTPSIGGTATLDLNLANEHRIQMPAGNITIALSNATDAQKFMVSVTQDSGGSRTVTWFTTIRWAGGFAPTLTTTASARDSFGFVRTGTGTYDGYIIGLDV